MSWVRKAPSGKWQARWRDPGGRERVRTFEFKAQARDFLTTTENAMIRGTYRGPRPTRDTLGAFWQAWRAQAEALGRPTERTLVLYDEIWRLYIEPSLGRRAISTITRDDVEHVVTEVKKRSAWRANDALKVLRMILNRAIAADLIAVNPAVGVQVPKPEVEEPWVLTPSELERLTDAMPERWRAFVLLGAYSSLRFSELVALRVDRLDLPRRRIRVEEKITEAGRLIRGEPKTRHSRRSVTVPEFVAFAIAEHIRLFPPNAEGLIFTMPEGGPVRRPAFYRLVWKPATVRAGLEGFRPGLLRHTGASLAIAAGANPLLVAARLGHTSTRMVESHYASLFEGLDRDIAAALEQMHADRDAVSERLRSG
jgi:integrase